MIFYRRFFAERKIIMELLSQKIAQASCHGGPVPPDDCGSACVFISPGNANLLIGVLNWISEEPSWGLAFPGTLTVYSTFYTVLCGKASAKIILAIDSNNSHPVEVDSKCIFPDSSHFSELYIILKDIVD